MNCFYCNGKGCNMCEHTGKFIKHGYVETSEAYTPVYIINDARKVMGCIDFDPASSKIANDRVIRATRYYTYKENGLDQEWYGNGWCNPPYGRIKELNIGLQALFIRKAAEEYQKGNVIQMMFLLHGNCMFRDWYLPFRQFPVCLLTNDVQFWKPDGSSYHNGYGSIIVYLGENVNRFYEVFRLRGLVYTKYEPHYSLVTTLPQQKSSLTFT